MRASSSGPPVERMPVTRCGMLELLSSRPFRCTRSPGFTLFRRAKFTPATHSFAPSENQRPSICHHGFVFAIPVTNFPPSARATSCLTHVPITGVSLDETPGEDPFLEAGDQARAEVSRTGANAKMLLRQKTVLILGRSDSGKYAPAF